MAGATDGPLPAFHASLNVADLPRAIAFYQALLGVEPAKVRADYAKFELADPPLVLSLVPGAPAAGGNLNHAGLRVRNAEALVAIQHRLEAAGLRTEREDGVECCYARQTKFWVTDPDRALWEVYVFHEDIDERGDAAVPRPQVHQIDLSRAGAPRAWAHRLGDPIPPRIPHDDNTLHEIRLEGTINAHPDAANLAALLVEARRALRPGASLQVHGLSGDRPGPAVPALPGPAAAVEHVPSTADVVGALVAAGFAGIRIETLSERAYFVVDGVPMRELRVTAQKAGHRPRGAMHQAIYLGPMRQVTDDFGNVFTRGVATPVNVHDWQMMAKGPARSDFLLLAPEDATAASGADRPAPAARPA
jgi:catechol 2,3-dioxygenase-like lactoylglutathione lyase family enzyme